MNSAAPVPNNAFQQLLYSLAKAVNNVLDPAPPPGTPTVGVPDPVTGVVTGSLGFPTGNGLTFTATQPSQGTVTAANDGTYVYTPTQAARLAAGPGTTDNFTATAHEGLSTSSVTVTVPISPFKFAPIAVGSNPTGLAASPDGKYLYVANRGDNSVSVIDASTRHVVTAIRVGTAFTCGNQCGPYGLAITPDGTRLYVTDSGSHPVLNPDGSVDYNTFETTVSVIDTVTNAVIDAIEVVDVLGATDGTAPIAVAMSPDGERVYVGYSGTMPVRVIDTETNTVISQTDGNVGVPRALAVSPDGKHVYVANLSKSIAVIDTGSLSLDAVGLLSGGAAAVAISPDGNRLYVSSQTVSSSSLTVLNTADGSTIASVTLGGASIEGQSIQGIAVSPDGKHVYVANPSANTIALVDALTNTVTESVAVGNDPQAVIVSPDGKYLYVSNRADNTVSVIQLT
jgi:YVTN family beta-propeller protein/VCBS repeat-containing protein